MTTQVIFKIDKKLKDKAMRKAQNQGLPFASVLKLATRAFVEGRLNVDLVGGEEKFNPSARREISAAVEDIAAGKNLSPRFSSAKASLKYLRG